MRTKERVIEFTQINKGEYTQYYQKRVPNVSQHRITAQLSFPQKNKNNRIITLKEDKNSNKYMH